MGRSSVVELLPEVWMVVDTDLPGLMQEPGNHKHRYGIGVVQRLDGLYYAGCFCPKAPGGKMNLGHHATLRDACRSIEVAFFD